MCRGIGRSVRSRNRAEDSVELASVLWKYRCLARNLVCAHLGESSILRGTLRNRWRQWSHRSPAPRCSTHHSTHPLRPSGPSLARRCRAICAALMYRGQLCPAVRMTTGRFLRYRHVRTSPVRCFLRRRREGWGIGPELHHLRSIDTRKSRHLSVPKGTE